MDIKEDQMMSFEDEVNHWWVKTRFLYIKKAISLVVGDVYAIEYGFGTGQNLWFLNKYAKKVIGVDPNWKGVDLFPGSVIELKNESAGGERFNLVLLLDVLEHIERPEVFLKEKMNDLELGGIVLITLPAFNLLWSKHDEDLGHYRRYTVDEISQLMHGLSFEAVKEGYIFSWLFLPALILRKILKIPNSDLLKKNSKLINGLMFFLGKMELYLNPIIGTSCYGIYRKN